MTPFQFNSLVTAASASENVDRHVSGLNLQCCRGGDCIRSQMEATVTPGESRRIRSTKRRYEEILPQRLCIHCAAKWYAKMLVSTTRSIMLIEGKYQP